MTEYIKKQDAKVTFINYMGATSVRVGVLAGCLYDRIPAEDVIPAEWIREKMQDASPIDSIVLSKLLRMWEKEKENE